MGYLILGIITLAVILIFGGYIVLSVMNAAMWMDDSMRWGGMYASEEENRKIRTGRKLKSVRRVPDSKMSTYNYKPVVKRNLPYQRRNF